MHGAPYADPIYSRHPPLSVIWAIIEFSYKDIALQWSSGQDHTTLSSRAPYASKSEEKQEPAVWLKWVFSMVKTQKQ